jgi:hypothetical protein
MLTVPPSRTLSQLKVTPTANLGELAGFGACHFRASQHAAAGRPASPRLESSLFIGSQQTIAATQVAEEMGPAMRRGPI